VILATDGAFNVGVHGLATLKWDCRASRAELTTLGFGDDNYNDNCRATGRHRQRQSCLHRFVERANKVFGGLIDPVHDRA
jgi:hypothetical protein